MKHKANKPLKLVTSYETAEIVVYFFQNSKGQRLRLQATKPNYQRGQPGGMILDLMQAAANGKGQTFDKSLGQTIYTRTVSEFLNIMGYQMIEGYSHNPNP